MFLNILTVLEIIVVEFISIWILSTKKHRFITCLSIYSGITIGLLLFMYFIAAKLPGYGNGNGRFFVLGSLYFIPALINYGGDKKSRIIIAFYSFTYGLAGFALAVRLSYVFDPQFFNVTAFVSESLLYLISFPLYIRFSQTHVIPYIQKANDVQKNLLIRFTIVSFLLIIVYNNVMVVDASPVKKLLVYMMLVYFVVLTYRLIVSYLKADKDIQNLNELVKIDRLTHLGNRLAFHEYIELMMSQNENFYLLFLDLNNFKSINDSYGHSIGDIYLQKVAEELRNIENENLCFRYGGDEFVCLTHHQDLYQQIKNIQFTIDIQKNKSVSFLGISIGMVEYPKESLDIDDLLKLADQRMYEDKKR